MKKSLSLVFGVICCLLIVAVNANSDSLSEAKALVEKAAAFYKVNGREKTIAELNNPKGQFRKGDMYAYAIGIDGMGLANPNPRLVGINQYNLKDADGKAFFKEMIDGAKSKESGWIDYKWTHPTTKKVHAKTVYYERIDDYVILGCGVYK